MKIMILGNSIPHLQAIVLGVACSLESKIVAELHHFAELTTTEELTRLALGLTSEHSFFFPNSGLDMLRLIQVDATKPDLIVFGGLEFLSGEIIVDFFATMSDLPQAIGAFPNSSARYTFLPRLEEALPGHELPQSCHVSDDDLGAFWAKLGHLIPGI